MILNESNVDFTSLERNDFSNIHQKYEHSYDLESLKQEQKITTNYLQPVKRITNDASMKRFMNCEFMQLDEKETKQFILNCKEKNSTVQGALSVTTMLCLLKENYDVLNETVKCINAAPCKLIYFFYF
jgi:hypothetical protein